MVSTQGGEGGWPGEGEGEGRQGGGKGEEMQGAGEREGRQGGGKRDEAQATAGVESPLGREGALKRELGVPLPFPTWIGRVSW